MAEVHIDGKRLILKDIEIYADTRDVSNQVGTLKLGRWFKNILNQASEEGFDELQMIGQRVQNSTSTNHGHINNHISNLNGRS